jgi:hypothetical protein
MESSLLSISLSAAVPLCIAEYLSRGGPQQDDVERARRFAHTLAEKGDILLYRGRKPGQTSEVFNGLADALAILAFCPGGVKVFGLHFQADYPHREGPARDSS